MNPYKLRSYNSASLWFLSSKPSTAPNDCSIGSRPGEGGRRGVRRGGHKVLVGCEVYGYYGCPWSIETRPPGTAPAINSEDKLVVTSTIAPSCSVAPPLSFTALPLS